MLFDSIHKRENWFWNNITKHTQRKKDTRYKLLPGYGFFIVNLYLHSWNESTFTIQSTMSTIFIGENIHTHTYIINYHVIKIDDNQSINRKLVSSFSFIRFPFINSYGFLSFKNFTQEKRENILTFIFSLSIISPTSFNDCTNVETIFLKSSFSIAKKKTKKELFFYYNPHEKYIIHTLHQYLDGIFYS